MVSGYYQLLFPLVWQVASKKSEGGFFITNPRHTALSRNESYCIVLFLFCGITSNMEQHKTQGLLMAVEQSRWFRCKQYHI